MRFVNIYYIEMEDELYVLIGYDDLNKTVDPKLLLKYFNNDNQSSHYYPRNECTDDMISSFIENDDYVDTKKIKHNGSNDSASIHSQRVASLINLINNNKLLDAVILHVDSETNKLLDIEDGYHRWRACLYTNKQMRVKIYYL